MIYALTNDNKKVIASPGANAICPLCHSVVSAKCGPTNIWHWAHDSLTLQCDSWNYEPKTKWHCDWQNRFHIDDTEVIIEKDGYRHIADTVGNGNVIIEIQNSPISADTIFLREAFYEKMLWILNGRQFANNLDVIGFDTSIDMHFLSDYIFYEDSKTSEGRVRLIVPRFEDGTIEQYLKSNTQLFEQDEVEEDVWYVHDINRLKNDELPRELKSAFIAFALEQQFLLKVDDTKSYPIRFTWRHLRRSWLSASQPVFIDIGAHFMIFITKHCYGNVFDGKIISKSRFLNKYRKRLPSHSDLKCFQ